MRVVCSAGAVEWRLLWTLDSVKAETATVHREREYCKTTNKREVVDVCIACALKATPNAPHTKNAADGR